MDTSVKLNGSSPRILVVDDDLGVIAAYRHVLEGAVERAREARLSDFELQLMGEVREPELEIDWRVDFVDQGEDAVKFVAEAVRSRDGYRVIFLDMRMPPGIDGYETARRIRNLDRRVHIVIVSANSDYDEAEIIAVAGPKRYLSFLPKPVWPDQLLATAQKLCARRPYLNRVGS
jgi:CheY-like chemotaxis protein